MRALLSVMMLVVPVMATPLWAAPETSPRPETRPEAAAPAAPAINLEYSPRPERRPAALAPAIPAAPAVAAPSGKGAICGVAGLTGRHLPPVTSGNSGCGIAEPVQLQTVQGVRLSMPLTMDCSAARALNEWVRVVVQPTFSNRVRRLDVAGAYVCRGRNNVRGAKISEHGRGRAVDVSGLTFNDGTSITVARNWNKGRDGQLMAQAYKAGCGIFGTTLGPGSDGYHEDHMHFDVPSNRRSPYCR